MVVIAQAGFLTDRSPLIRKAFSDDVMQIVEDKRVSFVRSVGRRESNDKKKRILIALK